mgnify:CR=1 FL=1
MFCNARLGTLWCNGDTVFRRQLWDQTIITQQSKLWGITLMQMKGYYVISAISEGQCDSKQSQGTLRGYSGCYLTVVITVSRAALQDWPSTKRQFDCAINSSVYRWLCSCSIMARILVVVAKWLQQYWRCEHENPLRHPTVAAICGTYRPFRAILFTALSQTHQVMSTASFSRVDIDY